MACGAQPGEGVVDDGRRQSEARADLGRGERHVRARVPEHQVADRIRDGRGQVAGQAHGQRRAEPVAQARGVRRRSPDGVGGGDTGQAGAEDLA